MPEHGEQCIICSSQIISEILPEIHTMEKFEFLKPIILSQRIKFSVLTISSSYSIFFLQNLYNWSYC